MKSQNSSFKRMKTVGTKEFKLLRNSFSSHKFLYLLVLVLIVFLAGLSFKVSRNIKDISKATRRSYKFLSKYRPDLSVEPPIARFPLFCHSLERFPLGEDLGIVKQVRELSIPGIHTPYNASIIEGNNKEYLLFFRYDVPGEVEFGSKVRPYRTYIGNIKLDKQFNLISTPSNINTGSDFSEDPRVVKIKNEYFLVYNDLEEENPLESRTMRVACLNEKDLSVTYQLNLDLNFQISEKNWVPFVHQEFSQNPKLYFAYTISPHKILKINHLKQNVITGLVFPNKAVVQQLNWSKKWGTPRGGTPAQVVDDEYLAFFHSSFRDSRTQMTFYVMGAYTFENHPPFRITRISKHPITFKGMYDIPYGDTASVDKRVIFPAGFVVEKTNKETLIHVSCGENDSGVKIVTLDKEALYKSLDPVPFKSPSTVTANRKTRIKNEKVALRK